MVYRATIYNIPENERLNNNRVYTPKRFFKTNFLEHLEKIKTNPNQNIAVARCDGSLVSPCNEYKLPRSSNTSTVDPPLPKDQVISELIMLLLNIFLTINSIKVKQTITILE